MIDDDSPSTVLDDEQDPTGSQKPDEQVGQSSAREDEGVQSGTVSRGSLPVPPARATPPSNAAVAGTPQPGSSRPLPQRGGRGNGRGRGRGMGRGRGVVRGRGRGRGGGAPPAGGDGARGRGGSAAPSPSLQPRRSRRASRRNTATNPAAPNLGASQSPSPAPSPSLSARSSRRRSRRPSRRNSRRATATKPPPVQPERADDVDDVDDAREPEHEPANRLRRSSSPPPPPPSTADVSDGEEAAAEQTTVVDEPVEAASQQVEEDPAVVPGEDEGEPAAATLDDAVDAESASFFTFDEADTIVSHVARRDSQVVRRLSRAIPMVIPGIDEDEVVEDGAEAAVPPPEEHPTAASGESEAEVLAVPTTPAAASVDDGEDKRVTDVPPERPLSVAISRRVTEMQAAAMLTVAGDSDDDESDDDDEPPPPPPPPEPTDDDDVEDSPPDGPAPSPDRPPSHAPATPPRHVHSMMAPSPTSPADSSASNVDEAAAPAVPPKPSFILQVSIPTTSTTKKLRFASSLTAREADAVVAAALVKTHVLEERDAKAFRLFRSEVGGRPFGASVSLSDLGLKQLDTVYFRRDAGDANGGATSAGLTLRVTAPHLNVSKVLALPVSATVDDTILMAAAALAKAKLLSSAEVGNSTSSRHRLCRRRTGAGRLGPGDAELTSLGVSPGDEVFLVADGANAGKRFTRLLPTQANHARVDVYLPHSTLADWGRSGPPAASLFAGCRKVGYLVKEGSAVKSWRERLFVLHNETLYYFAHEDDAAAKGWLVLTPAATVATAVRPKREHVFVINSLGRQLFLSAPTARDAQAWIDAISDRIRLLGDTTAHTQGLPVTPPEHTLVDTLWLDGVSVTGAEIVERAMRRLAALPLSLSKGAAAASTFSLHELTGESVEPDDVLADHLHATDYDDTVGFVEVQLKPVGQFGADTETSSGPSARQRANSATKEVSGTLRKGKNLLRAALRKGKSTALSTEEKVPPAGATAASAAQPSSSTSPVSPRDAAPPAGEAVLSAAVDAAEPIAQLDVSVAKSKPKSAGRRPPTRKKREPKQ